jgi:ABC-type transport system involved in multi-copper enzyme maturation permease subunit
MAWGSGGRKDAYDQGETGGDQKYRGGEIMRLKALLWIEWRQYRWYFALAFLAISPGSVIWPAAIWINRPDSDAWSVGIKSILATGSSTTETAAMAAAVLLAALMLAGERGGALNYLVAAPVSRREIIISKFISGWLAIITMMSVISLFFIVGQELRPGQYSIPEVMDWAVITTVALLCLFSLALLVASFTRGTLASALIATVVTGLPWILITIAGQVFSRFYTFSSQFEIKLQFLETYLFIPNYISRDGRLISNGGLLIDRVKPDYPLEITVLLLVSGLCLWGAMVLFEKNHLERRGEILLFGSFKHIAIMLISLLYALLWAGETAATAVLYLVYFPVMWLGSYLFIYATVWLLGWLAWKLGANG